VGLFALSEACTLPQVKARDDPAEIYIDLRSRALGITQAELGELPETPLVLGVLMETRYPEAAMTLVSLADGTTSLYFSNGGGMIGGGQHPRVAAATQRLVDVAARSLGGLSAATDFPLPALGITQLIAVTPTGNVGATAPEEELVAREHELSELFYAAQNVITELRLVEETSG
jgi:hypothetical protein